MPEAVFTPARTQEANGVHAPKAGKRAKKASSGRADRAAESLLRIAFAKHEQLSTMADNKAHIMLTISVGVIGVSATQLFDPQLQLAALTLIVTSLVAAGLAVLATTPSLPKQKEVDPSTPGFNLLFFSDFARLPYDAYEREMERVLADKTLANRALIVDLHSLGTVLNGKKFRLLNLCYRVFFGGLVAAAMVLAVTLLSLWS